MRPKHILLGEDLTCINVCMQIWGLVAGEAPCAFQALPVKCMHMAVSCSQDLPIQSMHLR